MNESDRSGGLDSKYKKITSFTSRLFCGRLAKIEKAMKEMPALMEKYRKEVRDLISFCPACLLLCRSLYVLSDVACCSAGP